LKYAKAKLDSSLRSAEAELDDAEGRLEARRAGKPWLGDERETPSYEDVKARIEERSGDAKPTPDSGDPAFDLEKQQRDAAKRLDDIRDSLGLDDDTKR
jgi:hypothetical protein